MKGDERVVDGGVIAGYVFGFLAILVIIIAIFGSFYIINPGQRGILLTWGKPSVDAKAEGLHFKVPFGVQKVIKMDIKTQKYETDASAASKDLQIVHTKIAVNYHLSSEGVVELYKTIGTDYEAKIIQPAVQEVVKANTAKFTAEELITHRELVKEGIDKDLKARLQDKGIYMETTSITNFDFSPEFNVAIEAKVTAEQNALTEKNRLAVVEYQAQQKVAEANGTATATIINAQASAEALRLQRQQVSPDMIQLRLVEKWNGVLPVYSMSGGTPLIQLPSQVVVNATN